MWPFKKSGGLIPLELDTLPVLVARDEMILPPGHRLLTLPPDFSFRPLLPHSPPVPPPSRVVACEYCGRSFTPVTASETCPGCGAGR